MRTREDPDHKIDRTGWPSGPWDGEPDKLNWIDPATGFDCMIVRNMSGALCGYVGVGQMHPAFGKGYNDVDADAHGGLTYASACRNHICHVPDAGRPDTVWWLGFDCNHSGDFAPGNCYPLTRSVDMYRDVAYVKTECAKLAEQLFVAE